MKELTDTGYWDRYWTGARGNVRVNTRTVANQAVFDMMAPHLPPPGAHLLEIGCAPGAWLRLFVEKYGYAVSGIDYSPVGVEQTRETFRKAGISGEIRQADLFQDELPEGIYDVVFSNGFVEHFDDLGAVMRRHALPARKGGIVVAFAPNLAGFAGRVKASIDVEDMAHHRVVRTADFSRVAGEAGLETLHCGYFGPLNLFVVQWGPRLMSFPVFLFLWGANQLLGYATRQNTSELAAGYVGYVGRRT